MRRANRRRGVVAVAWLVLITATVGCVLPNSGRPRWSARLPFRTVDRVFTHDGVLACFGWNGAVDHAAGTVSGTIVSVDATSGRELWSHPFEARARYGRTGGSSTYTFSAFGDGAMCLLGAAGTLHAFDARSGAELWTRQNVTSLLDIAYGHVYVVEAGSRVVVVNAATGESERTIATPGATEIGSSARLVFGNGLAFLAVGEALSAVESATGKALWTAKLRDSDVELVVGPGVVVASTFSAMTAYESETGRQLWSREMESELNPAPPIVSKNVIYTSRLDANEYIPDGGVMRRYATATGEKLGEFATVAFAGDLDVAIDGELFVQSVGERHYDRVSAFFVDLGYGYRWAESWDSKLVVRNSSTGAVVWESDDWRWGFHSRPVIDGNVFVTTTPVFEDEPATLHAYARPMPL